MDVYESEKKIAGNVKRQRSVPSKADKGNNSNSLSSPLPLDKDSQGGLLGTT